MTITPAWRVRLLKAYIVVRHKLEERWDQLVHDPLAIVEILSGLFLVALRGLLLRWGTTLNMPHDVTRLIEAAGFNEDMWATYLMVFGILQIAFAGERRSLLRLWVTIAILLGFVGMLVGFLLVNLRNPGKPSIIPSLVCMSMIYFVILIRVWSDREKNE